MKTVVARRYRRMRREHHLAGNSGNGLIEADSFVDHTSPNGLQHREPAMALVHVIDARGNAHLAESAHPANAQQQLLANADTAVAAVQTRRQLAIFRRVSV